MTLWWQRRWPAELDQTWTQCRGEPIAADRLSTSSIDPRSRSRSWPRSSIRARWGHRHVARARCPALST